MKSTAIEMLEKSTTGIKKVVYELSTLPASEMNNEKLFLKENLARLRRSEDHTALFGDLNLHWTYLSPHLLKHLVNKLPPLAELKDDMKAYMDTLGSFRTQTPLELFCRIDRQHIKPPEGFKEVVAKFEKVKSQTLSLTLQDVEDFRVEYGNHYQLRDFALMLHRGKENCFIITFFVPESIVGLLQSNIPERILTKFGITQLDVSGTCIFTGQSAILQQQRMKSVAPSPMETGSVVHADDRSHIMEPMTQSSVAGWSIASYTLDPLASDSYVSMDLLEYQWYGWTQFLCSNFAMLKFIFNVSSGSEEGPRIPHMKELTPVPQYMESTPALHTMEMETTGGKSN